MKTAASNYNGGKISVNYNPVYHIECSSNEFDIEDLKAMLTKRNSEAKEEFEQLIIQVMRDEEYRKLRMGNA